jgi:Peptidase family S41
MGAAGIREFIKFYYPQIRKEALIVDVRGNGGGNISQMLIERLRRQLLGTDFDRVSDYTGTYPFAVFYGPKVCLINETSASDGDIFPYMFRQAGLGPLIGKRTWGGVVGIKSLRRDGSATSDDAKPRVRSGTWGSGSDVDFGRWSGSSGNEEPRDIESSASAASPRRKPHKPRVALPVRRAWPTLRR